MKFKSTTAEEAVKIIKSNDRVYIQAAAAAPQTLINAMTARHEELRNVVVSHLHIEGEAPYADPKYKKSFFVNSYFIGPNVRHTLTSGNGCYTPVFLGELPNLFRRNIIDLQVALVSVSPPDKHGYCSLGVTVAATLAAIENADYVIAEVNSQMPRTHGDGIIHISEIDAAVEVNRELANHKMTELSNTEKIIGDYIAEMIEDGSTLQMGIGNIPNAVLSRLHNHKNLGIHTEMFSDGVVDLILEDVINGNNKKINHGKAVTTFLMGSKKLYEYVDDNPFIEMKEADYTNNVNLISQNPKVVSINSAIEVDLTGQVCADSIGMRMYSGVGGQMDFIRGASLSEGGKPIIALPSVTKKGRSRIVPFLQPGAGVVTTRAHVHYVVTEYGVANLYGKCVMQRIKELVKIAHPDHRETIERAYRDKKIY